MTGSLHRHILVSVAVNLYETEGCVAHSLSLCGLRLWTKVCINVFSVNCSVLYKQQFPKLYIIRFVGVFPHSGYGWQEVEGGHPEEHGDRSGCRDAQSDHSSGQPRVHRGQHEQLRLRGQVSNKPSMKHGHNR